MIISRPRLLLATCSLLCLIMFTIDIMIPLGVAAGVPYILIILITLYIPHKKSTIYFSLITCTLTIAGLFLSPYGREEWKVLLNRCLALFAIISTTFITLLIKNSRQQLHHLNSQLETIIKKRTTELKNTQNDLIQANRMAVLGQLTATISHELRNPLSVINASRYLLKAAIDTNDVKINKNILSKSFFKKKC